MTGYFSIMVDTHSCLDYADIIGYEMFSRMGKNFGARLKNIEAYIQRVEVDIDEKRWIIKINFPSENYNCVCSELRDHFAKINLIVSPIMI